MMEESRLREFVRGVVEEVLREKEAEKVEELRRMVGEEWDEMMEKEKEEEEKEKVSKKGKRGRKEG